MNKEEILKKAREEKDERELVIENKAHKLAAEIASCITAIMALYVVVDGFLLESGRMYDHAFVSSALVGICCLYFTVQHVYQAVMLKDKSKIFGAILFAMVTSFTFGIVVNKILF